MQNVIDLKNESVKKPHSYLQCIPSGEKAKNQLRPQCVWLLWTCWVGLNDRWWRGPHVLDVFITKYTIWLMTSALIKIMIVLFHYDRGRGREVICQ